ncbi:MAG: hypothetical protein MZV63_56525 [Marinilabiliales bacterium]|nr:hypothetical protein [Marinilabiliales bacterium]
MGGCASARGRGRRRCGRRPGRRGGCGRRCGCGPRRGDGRGRRRTGGCGGDRGRPVRAGVVHAVRIVRGDDVRRRDRQRLRHGGRRGVHVRRLRHVAGVFPGRPGDPSGRACRARAGVRAGGDVHGVPDLERVRGRGGAAGRALRRAGQRLRHVVRRGDRRLRLAGDLPVDRSGRRR